MQTFEQKETAEPRYRKRQEDPEWHHSVVKQSFTVFINTCQKLNVWWELFAYHTDSGEVCGPLFGINSTLDEIPKWLDPSRMILFLYANTALTNAGCDMGACGFGRPFHDNATKVAEHPNRQYRGTENRCHNMHEQDDTALHAAPDPLASRTIEEFSYARVRSYGSEHFWTTLLRQINHLVTPM